MLFFEPERMPDYNKYVYMTQISYTNNEFENQYPLTLISLAVLRNCLNLLCKYDEEM